MHVRTRYVGSIKIHMYVANVIVHSDDDSLCKDHVTIVTSDMQYQHSVESFQLLIYTTVGFQNLTTFV